MSSSADNSPDSRPLLARLTAAMLTVSAVFERQRVEYALIGGLSVAVRGNGRATEDADFLLHVPAIQLPRLLEAMVESGCTLDVMQGIRDWTEGGMLVVTGPGGVHVDCLKAVIPVFHRILERARPESFGEQTVRVADAEGLLLLKLIAFRPLDQEDIRGILAANAEQLDLDWVRREASLAGLDAQRMGDFESMVGEFYVA
ncbi:MAG: nucleotidyltransferase [Candidatus Saccharimonas sp.]|nr:nucleotidyltransferase [Planctomycetaceae bacterium]